MCQISMWLLNAVDFANVIFANKNTRLLTRENSL